MAIYVSNLMTHLEEFQGRDFETVYKKEPFKLLFHDTTKLRIRLPDRDISVPLCILLIGIVELLAHKKFSRDICVQRVGKEWGYSLVARLLLECEDVTIDPQSYYLELIRIPKRKNGQGSVKRPESATVAVNPNGNGCK